MNSIKTFRERANKTQSEIAEALGVCQSAVAMWETGQNAPRTDRLLLLSNILNCTVDDLLNPTDSHQEAG